VQALLLYCHLKKSLVIFNLIQNNLVVKKAALKKAIVSEIQSGGQEMWQMDGKNFGSTHMHACTHARTHKTFLLLAAGKMVMQPQIRGKLRTRFYVSGLQLCTENPMIL